jgi:UDP-N-acetylglucosamine 4-epimerase
MIQDKLVERVKHLEFREPIYQDFRPGDVRHSQACIDKAIKLLHYKPKFKISDGMDETISWYLNLRIK